MGEGGHDGDDIYVNPMHLMTPLRGSSWEAGVSCCLILTECLMFDWYYVYNSFEGFLINRDS